MVSVIMPTYNRGSVISRAIKSVLNQTYGNFELIIIDDGSTDNTRLIVDQYSDARIKYIFLKENMGGNHARNVGLKNIRGNVIAFLDSDNEWNPCYLENRLNGFRDENVGMVFGRVEINDGETFVFPSCEADELTGRATLKKIMLKQNVMDTNAVCIKKECWEQVGDFDENMSRLQDWEFFYRILVTTDFEVVFIDDILVYNFVQIDSISRKIELYWRNRYYLLKKYLHVCRELNYVSETIWSLFIHNIEALSASMRAEILGLFTRNELEIALSNSPSYRLLDTIKNLEDIITENMDIMNKNKEIFQKNQMIMDIQERWIGKKIEGKVPFENFTDRVKNIAIYGYGILGRSAYKELTKQGYYIKYIVDKNVKELSEGDGTVQVVSDVSDICQVDIIVVTAVSEYELIKECLINETEVEVVSIMDVM